jgi:hypothetical protein
LKKIFGIAEGLLNFANMNSSSLVKNRALLNRIGLQGMDNFALCGRISFVAVV